MALELNTDILGIDINGEALDVSDFGTMADVDASSYLTITEDSEKALTVGEIEFIDPSVAVSASLNLSALKAMNGMVRTDGDNTYKVKFKSKAVSASQVVTALRRLNPNTIISYSEELGEENLVEATDQPLWKVTKAAGTFIIEKIA